MKYLQYMEVNERSREELLPDFAAEFPYIATCAQLDRYIEPGASWHWHPAAELFYLQSGTLEYTTPSGKWLFQAGSGGFVNPNVLHSTAVRPSGESTVQLIHLFDPMLLSGGSGSRIDRKYILPLTAALGVEMIPLCPDNPAQAAILKEIRLAFELSEAEWGYEFRLREALAGIWIKLLEQIQPCGTGSGGAKGSERVVKMLMLYIHEHFREPISVEEMARSVHISKRACFRLFQDILHMSPGEYLRRYRMEKAKQLLLESEMSVTEIACNCGFGSSSYFGKIFREAEGCSPASYRRKWHDSDKILRE